MISVDGVEFNKYSQKSWWAITKSWGMLADRIVKAWYGQMLIRSRLVVYIHTYSIGWQMSTSYHLTCIHDHFRKFSDDIENLARFWVRWNINNWAATCCDDYDGLVLKSNPICNNPRLITESRSLYLSYVDRIGTVVIGNGIQVWCCHNWQLTVHGIHV